jgi:hypothetical protein
VGNVGCRPPEDVFCKLAYDEDLGYWVYKVGKKRFRARDLPFTKNHARLNNDMKDQKATGYEPYPLEFLAKALGMPPANVLEIIGKFGEFYRKVER